MLDDTAPIDAAYIDGLGRTITTLSEAADSWKRKYDFLAAETPYAYESASTK